MSAIEDNPTEGLYPMQTLYFLSLAQKRPAGFLKVALLEKRPTGFWEISVLELEKLRRIAVPLIIMNLTWYAKMSITTAFLGRLGELQLAGGTLGLTFGNVTGFSVLNGLCGAMEPICGQAFGAKNFKLLHKTLLMATFLLLIISLPVSFLWSNVDKILIHFGQEEDIAIMAKKYLYYLLPDLVVMSLLYPLKAYLSSQSLIVPIMLSSALSMAAHVPANIFLSKAMGLEGVSMAVWITDFMVVIILALYVLISENGRGGNWKEGGWWEQRGHDWIKLLKLSGPCCLTTCLEWWCYDILVLLSGRLPNAKQAVGVLAIAFTFDNMLFSVGLSIATCASTRVSNELGANQARTASRSAYISLAVSLFLGFTGSLVTIAARSFWGPLFSHDKGIIKGVKNAMLLVALVELVNFPLLACGGIVRGTARPSLGFYANISGVYLLALPLGIVLAFKLQLGLMGLLIGFLVGIFSCLLVSLVFIAKTNWIEEAEKAQILICKDENHRNSAAETDSIPT